MTLSSSNSSLTVAVDAAHPNNYAESISMGSELNISNMLFLRAGQTFYLDDKDENGDNYSPEGLNIGGGINYLVTRNMRIKLDYSYSYWQLFDNTQRFSLSLEF